MTQIISLWEQHYSKETFNAIVYKKNSFNLLYSLERLLPSGNGKIPKKINKGGQVNIFPFIPLCDGLVNYSLYTGEHVARTQGRTCVHAAVLPPTQLWEARPIITTI